MKVGFISLGCSKNLIDTEMMIGLFKNRKYEVVNNPKEAEVIIINTCGFIESAKEEAINTILEMAEYKNPKKGKCKILIATGCLVQRYKEDLEKLLPEVDMFLKYSDYAKENGKSAEAFNKVFSMIENEQIQNSDYLEFRDRVLTTGDQYAYIRIAEGCDNRCTYCAIPYIRGKFVSRPIEDVLEEASSLAKKGITEIILIAQDTSKYGIDIYGKYLLSDLLKELCKIDGIKWIRFLYTYPESITDELINVVKNEDKICKYFDIPIQHISDKILKRMGRHTTTSNIKNVLEKLRKEIPDVIIRTTLMVGFPGETKENFNELCEFVEEEKFDKLGAFSYSKEEGTPASRLKEQIHPMTKKSRYKKLMQLQKLILSEERKKYIGKDIEVIIEDISKDGKYLLARSRMDVPDIDGIVYIENFEKKQVNDLLHKYKVCKIEKATEYDFYAKIK